MAARYTGNIFHGIVLAICFIMAFASGQSEANEKPAVDQAEHSLVGAWTTRATGAPFEAHVFTFHGDGTMFMSGPAAGNRKMSLSVGTGPWAKTGDNNYIARFVEIAADPATGAYAGRVVVDLTIEVTGATFNAGAVTNYYKADGSHGDGPFKATLDGTRIPLPQAAQ